VNSEAILEKIVEVISSETGATMIEYSIMLAFIAAVCIAIISTIGQTTQGMLTVPGW
jgi:Flp pilus assembly pilin Flp